MNSTKTKLYPTNPLGIIALFVFLNETLATVTLKFMLDAKSELAIPMTAFVIIFPLIVSTVFFLILWRKKDILYSPSDFRSDESFLNNTAQTLIDRPRLINKIFSRLPQQPSKDPSDKSDLTREYSIAIVTAQTALSRNTNIDIPYTIGLMQKINDNYKTDRIFQIYLARLYMQIKDYDSAILTLRGFISALESSSDDSERKNVNLSDAHYNIACYHTLKAKNITKEKRSKEEIERLKQEAINELKISINLQQANIDHAKQDRDFDFFRDEVNKLMK